MEAAIPPFRLGLAALTMGDVTVPQALLALVVAVVGLSLLSLIVWFAWVAATGMHTIAAAARRSRRRPAGVGELAGVFPPEVLAELDEVMERVLLE